jgi:hypothetical protein
MIRLITVLVLVGLSAVGQASPSAAEIKITLERTGCTLDVTCPAYRIAIAENGSILYEGKHSVQVMGVRRSIIRPTAVRQLAQELVNAGYFDLPQSYGVCDDGAIVTTSLSMNDRHHEIRDGCGAGPDRLRELEDKIDKVSGSKRWVRGFIGSFMH